MNNADNFKSYRYVRFPVIIIVFNLAVKKVVTHKHGNIINMTSSRHATALYCFVTVSLFSCQNMIT